MAWLADRLQYFVDLNPESEIPIDRLATWLARLDDPEDERRGQPKAPDRFFPRFYDARWVKSVK